MDTLVLFEGHPAAVYPMLLGVEPGSEVIIAHTTESVAQANTMVEYLSTTELGDQLHFSLVDVGDCIDFDDCYEQLERIQLVVPYSLFYTDGSRVLAACAIWKHLNDHEGKNNYLRQYLDNWTGNILLDDRHDGIEAVDVSRNLELQDMVGVTGRGIEIGWGPVRTKDQRKGSRDVRAEAFNHIEQISWQLRERRPQQGPQAERSIRSGIVVLGQYFTGLSDPEQINECFGAGCETVVACLVALAADEVFGESEPYHVYGGVKILDYEAGTNPSGVKVLSEFDVVLQVRQRILHFEVKRRDILARNLFVDRDVVGRNAFGPEAFMWTVVFRSTNCRVQDQLEELEKLGHVRGTSRDRFNFDAIASSPEVMNFYHQLVEKLQDFFLKVDRVHEPDMSDYASVDVLSCVMGIPSVTQALVGEMALKFSEEGHDRPVVVGCLTNSTFTGPLPGDVERDVISIPALNARVCYRVASGVVPTYVGVTAGPKWAIGGFVRYAWEHNRMCTREHKEDFAQLVHLDKKPLLLTDDTYGRCIRFWSPETNPEAYRRQYEEPFNEVAGSGYFKRLWQKDFDSLDPVARSVAWAADYHDCEVFVPRGSQRGRLQHRKAHHRSRVVIDALVLTGRNMAALVAVVDPHRKRRNVPNTDVRDVRFCIVEEEAKLERIVGSLSRVLVVAPEEYVENMTDHGSGEKDRFILNIARMTNDWQSILHYGNDGAEPVRIPESFWEQLQ